MNDIKKPEASPATKMTAEELHKLEALARAHLIDGIWPLCQAQELRTLLRPELMLALIAQARAAAPAPDIDKVLAAAQAVVNEALDDAESMVHPCDVNDDDVKARAMPQPIQALYFALKSRPLSQQPAQAPAGDKQRVMRSLIEDAVANHNSPEGYIKFALSYFAKCIATQQAAPVATDELIDIGRRLADTVEVVAPSMLNAGTTECLKRLVAEWREAVASPMRAEDARDAARYRYLRNEAWGCNKNSYSDVHVCQLGPGVLKSAVTQLAEGALDSAIDAARAAQQDSAKVAAIANPKEGA